MRVTLPGPGCLIRLCCRHVASVVLPDGSVGPAEVLWRLLVHIASVPIGSTATVYCCMHTVRCSRLGAWPPRAALAALQQSGLWQALALRNACTTPWAQTHTTHRMLHGSVSTEQCVSVCWGCCRVEALVSAIVGLPVLLSTASTAALPIQLVELKAAPKLLLAHCAGSSKRGLLLPRCEGLWPNVAAAFKPASNSTAMFQ
jgi:hypothetical protein